MAIAGLDFAYSQSPVRSRNTVTSVWMLTSAAGNALVIAISLLSALGLNQAEIFFLYTGMMAVVLGIFILIAKRYKYVELE